MKARVATRCPRERHALPHCGVDAAGRCGGHGRHACEEREHPLYVRELDRLGRKLPKTIVCDNGPEFTSKAMFFWAKKTGTKLHFFQPGKPTQNAFVESFNGKFRDYCLNLHWFASLDRCPLNHHQNWQRHFNYVRPHRSLDRIPPAVFAGQVA